MEKDYRRTLKASCLGFITQGAGDNLQAGMLTGSIFPFVLVAVLIILERKARKGLK